MRDVVSGFGPVGFGSPRAHRAADGTADGADRPPKRRAAGTHGLQHIALQAAAATAQHTAERRAHLCSGLGSRGQGRGRGWSQGGGRGCGCDWVRVRHRPRRGSSRWRCRP
eukprot:scaffold7236_cov69-Phaeocystis_antarctica.AAC.7